MKKLISPRFLVLLAIAFLFLPLHLAAQERTLEELKEEILRRAQRNQHPISEVKLEDVKIFLSRLTSNDPDLWAREWSRIAEPYEKNGDELFRAGMKKEALEAYYQAYRYYYLGRWPLVNSQGKKEAYQKAIRTFMAAGRLFDPPLERVTIPSDGKQIVGYLRLPKGVAKPPMIFHWGGIDGWKEDIRDNVDGYLAAGWGSFVIDIPGTGENPILATPDADRLFSNVLDYLQTRPEIDANRIAIQGSSWGGYWAAKLAHIERRRIKAAVNWGGPIHYYFQPEWQLKALQTREYLFGLFQARSALYGVNTLEAFLDAGSKLSLQALGILGQPSAPILSVNGKNDTQVPISDLYILMETGSPKAAWVNPTGRYMGSGSGVSPDYILKMVVVPWLRTCLSASSR
jgi:esterase/lipase